MKMYDFLINIFLESQTNDFQTVRNDEKSGFCCKTPLSAATEKDLLKSIVLKNIYTSNTTLHGIFPIWGRKSPRIFFLKKVFRTFARL
jgi:hypothetical protein